MNMNLRHSQLQIQQLFAQHELLECPITQDIPRKWSEKSQSGNYN